MWCRDASFWLSLGVEGRWGRGVARGVVWSGCAMIGRGVGGGWVGFDDGQRKVLVYFGSIEWVE